MGNWQRTMMKAMRIKNHPVVVRDINQVTDYYWRFTFYSPSAVRALGGFATEWLRLWVPNTARGDREVAQRGYTVTRIDRDAMEFDVEIILHPAAGPAGDWARRAHVGETLEVAMTPAVPKLAPQTRTLICFGDLSALPAINSWIGQAENYGLERLVVLMADAHLTDARLPRASTHLALERHEFSGSEDLFVALAQAVAANPQAYAWGAGEKDQVRRARALLKTLGVGRERSFTQFYWIRGKAFA